MTIDLKTLETIEISQEEKDLILAEAKEQYGKLQDSTKKGVEIMNKAIDFNNSVDGDVEKIKEFNAANPEAAKIWLEKFRPGKTLDEVLATESTFDVRVNEVVEQKKVEEIIQNYTNQIPENLREQFQAELNDFAGDKKLTLNNVEKFVEAALNTIAPKMDVKVVEKAKIAAIGAGGNKSGGSNSQSVKEAFDKKIKEQSNELLKNAGIAGF